VLTSAYRAVADTLRSLPMMCSGENDYGVRSAIRGSSMWIAAHGCHSTPNRIGWICLAAMFVIASLMTLKGRRWCTESSWIPNAKLVCHAGEYGCIPAIV